MGLGDPKKKRFTVISVRPGCFLQIHFPPLAYSWRNTGEKGYRCSRDSSPRGEHRKCHSR